MNECKEKLILAIEKNELINFLEGKYPYTVEMHQWVSAEVPTDISRIVSEGIYVLYKERPNLHIDNMFETAILNMMGGEVFDIYMALIIIFDQLLSESYKTSPFEINKGVIISKLKEILNINKSKLLNYFEWQGKGKEQGMWDEVIRIDSICKKKFKISIIE